MIDGEFESAFHADVYLIHERVGRRVSLIFCPLFGISGAVLIILDDGMVIPGTVMMALTIVIALPLFGGKRTKRYMAVIQCTAIMIILTVCFTMRFHVEMSVIQDKVLICTPQNVCVATEDVAWNQNQSDQIPSYVSQKGALYHAAFLLNMGLLHLLAIVFAALRSWNLHATYVCSMVVFHALVRTNPSSHLFYGTIAFAILCASERSRASVEEAWRNSFRQKRKDAANLIRMSEVLTHKTSELNTAWENLRVAKSGDAEIQRHRLTMRTLLGEFVDPTSVKFHTKIGSGSFGEVWMGEWGGKAVAVKQLLPQERERTERSKQTVEQVVREFAILFRVHHPHIVRLFGVIWEEGALPALVLEYVPNGTLGQLLYPSVMRRASLHQSLTWHSPFLRILMNVCEALEYLHTQRPHQLLHRDLKPDNIFMTQQFSAKLGDLGEARNQAARGSPNSMSRVGSPVYVAPEIIRGEHYGTQVDVYSLGIVFNECDSRQRPYKNRKFNAISVASDPTFRPHIQSTNQSFRSLVVACWDADPRRRPSATEILASIRINGSDWDHG